MSKFAINKLNIAKIFFLLFLTSLFFPVRYVFPTTEAFQTGAYSDFTSISLYLSDIFLFLTVIFAFLPRGVDFTSLKRLNFKNLSIIFLVFWLILDLIWHNSTLSSLNWWFLAKYMELMVSYGTAYYLFSKTNIKALFLRTFVLLSTFESILALWQFVNQKSFGLGKIGEQVLSPKIQGIAKIVSGGTEYIRGYGTFPHPNLLSAFLVVGVVLSIYLYQTSSTYKTKAIYSVAILINLLGLTTTFSRAGFLACGVALIIYFGQLFLRQLPQKKEISKLFLITIASILLCFVLFKPFLSTRATISDSASLERIFYAKLGWQMTKQHPVFGVGIGESVLHMQQYSPFKLWPWQVQPVHNYFLLSAAELGIPGALILVWILISHLWQVAKQLKTNFNPYLLSLFSILLAFLLLMQFDHYFYTLQQTQMLLWVTLAIVSSETKNPQEGDY